MFKKTYDFISFPIYLAFLVSVAEIITISILYRITGRLVNMDTLITIYFVVYVIIMAIYLNQEKETTGNESSNK